jgi:hypothetical protein
MGDRMMNVKDLITESSEGNKISLGRVMAWIVFGMMTIQYWGIRVEDIPENMLYVFGFLMSYNVAKKVKELGSNYVDVISMRAKLQETIDEE